MTKRLFDIVLSSTAVFILIVPILFIALLIKISSKGKILYWSSRVGKNGVIFSMPKFRTMKVDVPEIATHLLEYPEKWITPLGSILRKSSLDELPQLWSIVKGEMSLVGPRPALFNQHDLISLRKSYGVDQLTPGLTGWAQINGRDNISIEEKVNLDYIYSQRSSIKFDFYIIYRTILSILHKSGISH